MSTAAAAAGRRGPLDQHVRRVDTIGAIAPPPPGWVALRERWDQLTDFCAVPLRERLISTVLDGAYDHDLPTLKALAMAEASGVRTDVITDLRSAVYPRLLQLYSEVADTNYGKVGKEFDATATEFSAAAEQCNPEADGDSIVGEPDSVRTGWLDCAKYAARLDKLVPVLCAAAELAGIYTGDDTMLLPLLVDPSGCHRRRVWEAWKADGARCGRWGCAGRLRCPHTGRQPRGVRALPHTETVAA